MGYNGQRYIHQAYTKLTAFVETHPQFQSDLPDEHRCHDDGTGVGLSGAMMALAEHSKDGQCVIM